MIQLVPSASRYHFQNDWLSTYWHFSFDHYRDPDNVSFGPLRVFNDDTVRPASGFDAHAHWEMEILTVVLDGELEHRDDAGHHGVLRGRAGGAFDVQRMSAGTGIRHAERNPSPDRPVHFLQVGSSPRSAAWPPPGSRRALRPPPAAGLSRRSSPRDPATAP